jgi:hypothetical protein
MGSSFSTPVVMYVSDETRLVVWFKKYNEKITAYVDQKACVQEHQAIVQRRCCTVDTSGGYTAIARANPDTVFDKCKELLDTNRPLIISGTYTKQHLLQDLQELYEFGPTLSTRIADWATSVWKWFKTRTTSLLEWGRSQLKICY